MLGKLLRRLDYLVRRRRHEADLREEMAFHREMSGGRAFGNATLAREEARAVWVAPISDVLWRDARYAVRTLRREPAFAATAILTFALGLAVTATVFSVVDAELWKPLPYPHPDRLAAIDAMGKSGARDRMLLTGPELEAWRGVSAFEAVAGVSSTSRRVLHRDTAESIRTVSVTPDYFTTLGRTAVAGRTFDPRDTGAAVVLTDRAWRRLFAADASIVGRSLTIDDTSLP